jgi:hypothetical protein
MKTTKRALKKAAEAIAKTPKRSKTEQAFTLRRWDASAPLTWVGDNPHPEGTYQHNLREATAKATTVAAFIAIAATVDIGKASTPSDFLKGWQKRGLVKVGEKGGK